MTEDVDYFANHRLKLRFPWRLYHGPIIRALSAAIRDAPGPAVLNVGSGPFFELDSVPHEERHFTVCDIDPRSIELAKRIHGDRLSAADIIGADGTLPYPDESFDLVVAMDVIEHVLEPAPWLAELMRVTRRGGTVFLTTPNYASWSLKIIENTILEVIARLQRFSRKGLHPTPLDPPRLRRLLVDAGARDLQLRVLAHGWVVSATGRRPSVAE